MQNVTIDRHKYIGGSDIPVIMNISSYKSRFDLLLEKAQLKDDDFGGNEYTEYGNIMEEKIREYINDKYVLDYQEDKRIDKDLRYHADGYDIENNILLEIKTTSKIYDNLEEYKTYLVQLLFGMMVYDIDVSTLAVYKRDEHFNTEFDENNLTLFTVRKSEFTEILNKIKLAVEQFRIDLEKVKENPLITEEELQPKDIVSITNNIIILEEELALFKEKEKQLKEFKSSLKELMKENNIKKWETPQGIKITLVEDGKDKLVKDVDYKTLLEENEELAKKYEIETIKKGRAGYVKITLPKAI